MKKSVLLLLLFASFAVSAQQIDLQAGIRSGVSTGVSLRVLTGTDTWSEAMLLNRRYGIQLYALCGKTKPFPGSLMRSLTLNTGFGGHVGNVGGYGPYREGYSGRFRHVPVAGADLYVSVDYSFQRIPLSLSIDYKPFAELNPDTYIRFNFWDFGCTVRYQFTVKNN